MQVWQPIDFVRIFSAPTKERSQKNSTAPHGLNREIHESPPLKRWAILWRPCGLSLTRRIRESQRDSIIQPRVARPPVRLGPSYPGQPPKKSPNSEGVASTRPNRPGRAELPRASHSAFNVRCSTFHFAVPNSPSPLTSKTRTTFS